MQPTVFSKVGDSYRIVLKQIEKHGSINTATHEGMGDVHKKRLNEQDRVVKGDLLYTLHVYITDGHSYYGVRGEIL